MKNFYSRGFLKYLVCAVLISSCATPTPYKSADGSEHGYRDQKIQDEQYRVSFKGNRLTPRATVENYLLYRAAELTSQKGFDYFVMNRGSTDVESGYASAGPTFFGGYGFGLGHSSAFGIGVQTPVAEEREYEAFAYITLHKGPIPKDNESAYDAREIIKNLGPNIRH